ncbi:hypothetical protein RCZ04_12500 [Capnocytophaga sp. HP1101]
MIGWGQENADTLLLKLKEQQSAQHFYEAYFGNPAAMPEWGKYRFSSVQTAYEGSDKEAYAQQYPEGHRAFSVKASSYFPCDSTRTLWGDASYKNRDLKHIRWNESVDANLLYPYFTADTIGGDLHSEQYAFKGGFAKQWHRLHWGITIDYQAELASRDKDPRPKDITSNLRLRSGFLWRVGEWQTGVYGAFQKYTQSNELKFFNELGMPSVYHLNGLGYYNHLLKGTKLRAFYEGYAYGGGMTISRKGNLFLTGDYQQLRIEKYMTEDNGVIAATLTNSTLNAELTKLFSCAHYHYGLKLGYYQQSKKGVEPILSGRNSNWTEVIARNKNYTFKNERYELGALFSWDKGGLYRIAPYVSYETYREDYTLVRSFQHFDYANAGMAMSVTTCLGRKSIGQAGLQYRYRKTLSESYLLRNDSDEVALSEMLAHNARFLASDYQRFGVNLQYHYQLSSSLSYFVGFNSEIEVFTGQKTNTFYQFSLGLTF